MSLLDLDLSDYDIYSDDLEKYKECANLVKLAYGVANEADYPGERKRKAKRIKELLKYLKEDWFCVCCDKQSLTKRGHDTHLTSIEHKAKSNGKEMKICSKRQCRKKCIGKEGLEQHLIDSPNCMVDCNKNKCVLQFKLQKRIWEREIELFSMKNNPNHEWSEEDRFDYNRMMRKHQSQNPEGWGLLTMNEKGLLQTDCVATDPEPETNFYNTAPIIVSDLPEGFAGHDDWEENMKDIEDKMEMDKALQAQEQWEMEQQKIKDYEDKMEQLAVLEGMVPTEVLEEGIKAI